MYTEHSTAPDSNARDEHGQIQGKSIPPFGFASYEFLLARYRFCQLKARAELLEDLETLDEASLIVEIDDYVEVLKEDCIDDLFDAISGALVLVFGAKPSTGFICGTKEAVLTGKPIAGSCCLDAPFELDGNMWGHEVSETLFL